MAEYVCSTRGCDEWLELRYPEEQEQEEDGDEEEDSHMSSNVLPFYSMGEGDCCDFHGEGLYVCCPAIRFSDAKAGRWHLAGIMGSTD